MQFLSENAIHGQRSSESLQCTRICIIHNLRPRPLLNKSDVHLPVSGYKDLILAQALHPLQLREDALRLNKFIIKLNPIVSGSQR